MTAPQIVVNGGPAGEKAAVSAFTAWTATLDSTAGVRSTVWEVISTDETTTTSSYVLVQSGSVGQTVDSTSLGLGTALILKATINGMIGPLGEPDPLSTTATVKIGVLTSAGLWVGAANEETQHDPTFGSTEIINSGVRLASSLSPSGIALHIVKAATNAALPTNTRTGNVLTADANGAFPFIDTTATVNAGEYFIAQTEGGGASHVNNGVYQLTDAGSAGTPWVATRATYFDESGELIQGTRFTVQEGTAHGGTERYLVTSGATINVTPLQFAAFGGSAPVNAQYLVGTANPTLTNEIPIDDLSNPLLLRSTTNSPILILDANDTSTTGGVEALRLRRGTAGVATNGIAGDVVFEAPNSDNDPFDACRFSAGLINVTPTSETGFLSISLWSGGVSTKRFTLSSDGDLDMDGDLTVGGNLVVNGTSATIADRLPVLNASTGIVSVPSAIAGLVIDRGSADGITKRDGVAFLWNEAGGYGGIAYNTTLDQSTIGAYLVWRAGALVAPTLDGPATTLTLGATNTSLIARPGGTNGVQITSTGQRTYNAATGEWTYQYWGTQLRAYAKKSVTSVNATPINALQYPPTGTLPASFTASATITARMADTVTGDSAFIRRHYRVKRRASGSVTLAEVGIGAQVFFGADNIGTTTTARYPFPGYVTGAAPTSATPFVPSVVLPLSRISYSAASAGVGVDNITATLRRNGATTALAVTFLPTETVKTATIVDPITFVPGVDNLDIEVTKANNITSSPNDVVFTVAGYGEIFRDDRTHLVALRESAAVLIAEWTGDATNQTVGDVSLEVHIDEYTP